MATFNQIMKAYKRNGLMYYGTNTPKKKTMLERVQEVTKRNTPPRKVLWSDLPKQVLDILKQAGIYPPKKRKP